MRAKLTQSTVDNAGANGNAYDLLDTELKGLLLRVEKSGVKTFFVRYRRPNGKVTRYKLGRADALRVAQARALAREKLVDVANGKDPVQESRKAREQTLKEFLDDTYLPQHVDHLRSRDEIRRRLDKCFKFLHGRQLSDANIGMDVQKWMATRKKEGRSPSTINRDVSVLRGAFSYALRHKLIREHPLAGVRPLREEEHGRVRYLTEEEDKKLRDALEKRDKKLRKGRARHNEWCRARGYEEWPSLAGCRFADYLYPLVLLAMHTGLRRGELFNLQWSDVHLKHDPPRITVRADGTKSARTRHVPLSDTAFKALRDWRKQQDSGTYVFTSPKTGGRLDNIKTSWTALMTVAGIEDLRFHDLRHDFASKLVMRGVNLNTVRDLLGHADLKMTLRYAHLAPQHNHAAVRVLDNAY